MNYAEFQSDKFRKFETEVKEIISEKKRVN